MKTLFKIAWRNCWRNRLRSLIVIFAIIFGIWSSIFLMGFSAGFMESRVNKMIDLEVGSMQIHSKTFDYDNDISNTLEHEVALYELLDAEDGIVAYTTRFTSEGSALTAHGQNGIKIIGVHPEAELQTLKIGERMQEGTFLDSKLSYPIVVGKKLAEELHLKLKSKIQISFTNIDASQITKNFKVCGIYSVGNDNYEQYNVFVPQSKIEKLTGVDLKHEIIIRTTTPEAAKLLATSLQEKTPDNLVQSYAERYPEIAYMEEMMGTSMFIVMSIIVFALLFGIVNTLTMSILERKRELGILQAVGMRAGKIRLMIVLESVIYGLIGAPIGVLLGYLTISYYNVYGFDLSAFGQGMSAFGYDPILYLSLAPKYYFIYTAYILFATIIGGLYPSRLATKLNPITAIRAI